MDPTVAGFKGSPTPYNIAAAAAAATQQAAAAAAAAVAATVETPTPTDATEKQLLLSQSNTFKTPQPTQPIKEAASSGHAIPQPHSSNIPASTPSSPSCKREKC